MTFLKVMIQSLLIGFALLAIHLFGHAWPVAAQKPEIVELFSGFFMTILFHVLNVLAWPLDKGLGWMWMTFDELNLVGPILLGFLVTGLLMRRKNLRAGVANA